MKKQRPHEFKLRERVCFFLIGKNGYEKIWYIGEIESLLSLRTTETKPRVRVIPYEIPDSWLGRPLKEEWQCFDPVCRDFSRESIILNSLSVRALLEWRKMKPVEVFMQDIFQARSDHFLFALNEGRSFSSKAVF